MHFRIQFSHLVLLGLWHDSVLCYSLVTSTNSLLEDCVIHAVWMMPRSQLYHFCLLTLPKIANWTLCWVCWFLSHSFRWILLCRGLRLLLSVVLTKARKVSCTIKLFNHLWSNLSRSVILGFKAVYICKITYHICSALAMARYTKLILSFLDFRFFL